MHKTPNILWDGYGFEHPNSGVFTYAQSLLDELKTIDVFPTLFLGLKARKFFSSDKIQDVLTPKIWGKTKLSWIYESSLALQEFVQNVSVSTPSQYVYHGLSNINLPILYRHKNIKYVITVHDIIPLLPESHVSFSYFLQFKFLFTRILEHADAVVFVSQWTQNLVHERYPFIEKKSHFIPNGFNFNLEKNLDEKYEQNTDQIRVLCVSRFEHYKRLDLLLKILKHSSSNLILTLVTDANGFRFFEKNAEDFIRKGRLVILRNINTSQLHALYKSTDTVIHPSLYEGFCLPAVEALNYSKPFIYTKGSAIDDTVGPHCGLALTANASVDEWLGAIQDSVIMKDSETFKQSLQMHISKSPTWGDSAKKLADLYTHI